MDRTNTTARVRATLSADLLARVAPVTLATEQVLPVAASLETLLPAEGLARGSVVGVVGPGATTLATALAAGPSAAGSWTVVVGIPTFGLAAAADIGLGLDRVALVAQPSSGDWAEVVASLIGAFDIVLVRPTHKVGLAASRRLLARARERGSVLIHVQAGSAPPWPEAPDLTLTISDAEWEGLGRGHGHLRARRVRVDTTGRRRAARPRTVGLWLPGSDGRVAVRVAMGSASPVSAPLVEVAISV